MTALSTAYKRTVFLTGGSSGIGFFAAKKLATDHPDTLVVIASRSKPTSSLPPNVSYRQLDLISRSQIRSLVETWSYPPISALICNAALAPMGSADFTNDGIEVGFAANHVGHALLFFLLKDKKALSADCRIIFVSSGTHNPELKGTPSKPEYTTAANVAKAATPKLADGSSIYPTTKAANVIFANALDKRVKRAGKDYLVNSFSPGLAAGTRLSRSAPLPFRIMLMVIFPTFRILLNYFMGMNIVTPRASGASLAKFATSEEYEDVSGKYFTLEKMIPSSKDSYDVEKQDDLWDWTVNELAKDAEEKKSFNEM